MLETVLARDLTVRQTEAAVRAWLDRNQAANAAIGIRRATTSKTDAAAERLQRALSTEVIVRKNAAGRGAITIKFTSEDQLEELISRIGGESLF
jgi:ParB-like chromosome segregation protein Spo0J